jgi:hypothetical protein
MTMTPLFYLMTMPNYALALLLSYFHPYAYLVTITVVSGENVFVE